MIYQTQGFQLDTDRMELSLDGDLLEIEPQVLRILILLIENRDRVVTRDELIDEVWNGRIVSETTLSSRINSARRALGDSGKSQSFIRTYSKRGFRFVADVQVVEDAPNGADSAEDTVGIGIPSIAVLPFSNLGGNSEQEYFCDGVAEDIIAALSRIRSLIVVARNSSFSYKGQSPDVRQASRDLGVRYILEGSLRKSGDGIRLAVQLVEGESGKTLWAERYDRAFDNIFDVQDDIVQSVVGALHPELGKAEQDRARAKRAESLDAWDAYQRGMWHTYRRTRDDLQTAIAFYKKAIGLDPDFAAAHWGLAICYFYNTIWGWAEPRNELLDEALNVARRGVELDPADSMSHTALGYIHFVRREPDSAAPALESAIELDPNNYLAPRMLGITLTGAGRAEQGLPHLHNALRLSPRDPLVSGTMGWLAASYFFAGDSEAAVFWARRGMRLRAAPQIWTVTALLSVLGASGQLEEAKRVRTELLRLQPDITCAFVRENIPIVDPDYLDQYIGGLAKAGLPKGTPAAPQQS